MGAEAERLTSTENLKEVQIGHYICHVTNIGTLVFTEEERELADQLIKNADLFSWAPSDMQGKQKVSEKKRVTIYEEVGKLYDASFITKMKYTTWLANMGLVRKTNNI